MADVTQAQQTSARNAMVAALTASSLNSVRSRVLSERLVADGWAPPKRWRTGSDGPHVLTDGKLRITVRGSFGQGGNPAAAEKLLDILNLQDIELPRS